MERKRGRRKVLETELGHPDLNEGIFSPPALSLIGRRRGRTKSPPSATVLSSREGGRSAEVGAGNCLGRWGLLSLLPAPFFFSSVSVPVSAQRRHRAKKVQKEGKKHICKKYMQKAKR